MFWKEEGGIIFLTVVSDGTTGPEWIRRLERGGFRLSKWAKDVLNSPDFKSTGGVVYHVAILKGSLFSDNDRITEKIRAEAGRRKFGTLNAEVACLIRENFSDKDIKAMGLVWLVIMHEPIEDSGGKSNLLGVGCGVAGCWLAACCGRPDNKWDRGFGFALVLSDPE